MRPLFDVEALTGLILALTGLATAVAGVVSAIAAVRRGVRQAEEEASAKPVSKPKPRKRASGSRPTR